MRAYIFRPGSIISVGSKLFRVWYFRTLIELDLDRANQEVEKFKEELGYDDLSVFLAEIELLITSVS